MEAGEEASALSVAVSRPVTTEDAESTSLLGKSGSSERETTYMIDLKVLSRYSSYLIVANMLQFTLNMSPILIISRRGKIEFGAVSVATTTANITGFMVFQGLATSLDTLCAQAWGAGNPWLKQLHAERMTVLLATVGIPIAMLWFCSDHLFRLILPEPQIAMLAGLYLRILVCSMPGYLAFEAGKRILTAEGIFFPVTAILCTGAFINGGLGWLLVWHYDWGFIGAPIAVATTWTLVPVNFWLYLRVSGKAENWPSITAKALGGWGPMLRLAFPGLLMVEAEYLAFEILVVASAQLSPANLAAQTILATLNNAFWQIPFSVSVAGTTMIAQHIGARSAHSAKISARVVFISAFMCSASNSILFYSFRAFWPRIFTKDQEVIELVENALTLVALMQLLDGLVACCNGILRGCGRQSFGGCVNLSCYYIVALPVSLWTTFGLHWGLRGLWTGVTLALALVTLAELLYLINADWHKSVEDAVWRNSHSLDQEP